MTLASRAVILLALLAVLGSCLGGCATTTTRTEGNRVLERIETPTPDGGKIIREKERTEVAGETVTKADLSAAVASMQALINGLQGNLPSALAALVPKPPPVPTPADIAAAVRLPEEPRVLGMSTTELIALAATLWGAERGVAAYHKRRRLRPETTKT